MSKHENEEEAERAPEKKEIPFEEFMAEWLAQKFIKKKEERREEIIEIVLMRKSGGRRRRIFSSTIQESPDLIESVKWV